MNHACIHCEDSGHSRLSNGEVSDYLDCRYCDVAAERAALETAFPITCGRDADAAWDIHQRAKAMGQAEAATKIAELKRERDQAEGRIITSNYAFKRIAQAHHAALVAGNGDAGEIAKLADYLNPSAVSHEAWRSRAVELEKTLFETLELLENTDGLSKNNVDNLAGEQAEEIRKVLYLPVNKVKAAPDYSAQRKQAEQDLAQVMPVMEAHGLKKIVDAAMGAPADKEPLARDKILELARDRFGWAYGLGGFEDAVLDFAGTVLTASTALQAPVREVPGWQPIETAPTDDTPVMLYCPKEEYKILIGERSYGDWYVHGNEIYGETCGIDPDPTHWCALPAAPVQEPKP